MVFQPSLFPGLGFEHLNYLRPLRIERQIGGTTRLEYFGGVNVVFAICPGCSQRLLQQGVFLTASMHASDLLGIELAAF